jgi:hypothetical protein
VLESVNLDRVDSISDLEVIMENRMSFIEHVDFTVGRALAMLKSSEFRDPYTLSTLYVSLVSSKLEYANFL